MTIYVADIAAYQDLLTPSGLYAAGFTGVNVKISDGLGTKSVHPNAAGWLADARFTRSTFHYLRPNIAGADQAAYAYSRLRELVPAGPVAHVLDVEQTGVTYAQVSDYVATMARLLGRPIAIYTGDWFWPASWTRPPGAQWLWAAPNAGYRSAYPGDTSVDWRAGYGGWDELSVMQYAVGPLAGDEVSKSAVREVGTWESMRGAPLSTSQNGWPIVAASAVDDGLYEGVEFPNGALKGDVAFVFRWLIHQLHTRVEPIRKGACWGWYVKNINGGTTASNHGSGTALDYNADTHAQGVRNTYGAGDRDMIHAILAEADGVFRWGGDYTGTPDDMHFEIVKSASAVKALRTKLEEKPMTPEEAQLVWTRDTITNPKQRLVTEPTNAATQAGFAVGDMWQLVYNLRDAVATQAKAIAALDAKVGQPVTIDVTALAAALAPQINTGTEESRKAEVKAAVFEVLKTIDDAVVAVLQAGTDPS